MYYMTDLLRWDIYEITTETTEIHGVMLRGRIRKLGLKNGFNVLCENATDADMCVRFAVLNDEDAAKVTDYLKGIIADVQVAPVQQQVVNPVLSKLKVNKEERYSL